MKIFRNGVVLLSALLLCACVAEKKVTVLNADPDQAFLLSQSVLRGKLPAAKITVDMEKRSVKATDPGTADYPSYTELKFQRSGPNTLVTISADGDNRQLENLYYLLNTGVVEAIIAKNAVAQPAAVVVPGAAEPTRVIIATPPPPPVVIVRPRRAYYR